MAFLSQAKFVGWFTTHQNRNYSLIRQVALVRESEGIFQSSSQAATSQSV